MYMYALCWHQRHQTLHAAEDVFHLSQTQAEVMHPHKFKGRLYNLLSVADVTAVLGLRSGIQRRL